MRLTPRQWFVGLSAALPVASAWADDVKLGDAETASMGLAVLSVVVFAILVLLAVFIWLAAAITGLEGGFARAFKAAAISIGLSVGLSLSLSMLYPGGAAKGGGLVSLLIGTLSVKFAYNCGLGQAAGTYIVSVILAVAAVFVLATYVFHAKLFG